MTRNDDGGKPLELPAPVAELSARYPARPEREWDALVSRIVASAEPELARRRREHAVVRSILRWARPLAVCAAAVLLVGAIGLTMTSDAEVASASPSFAEVVDREPATVLLSADGPPTASDVATVLDADFTGQGEP
jgi:hypothetical protein